MTQKCTSYKRHGMPQFTCCFAWFILLMLLKRDLIWDFFQTWPWLSNPGTIPSCILNVYDKIHNISYPVSSWYAAYLVTDHYFPNISKSHFRDVRIWLIIQIPKSNYYQNFHLLSTSLLFFFFFFFFLWGEKQFFPFFFFLFFFFFFYFFIFLFFFFLNFSFF